MKLIQIEMENFRCFERLRVSLEDDVTAVIGVNGAGKTGLLDAIALSLLPLLQDIARRQPNAATLDLPTFYRHFAGSAIAQSDIRLNAPGRVDRDGEQVLRLSAKARYQEGSAEPPLVLEWQQEAGVTPSLGTSRFSQRWVSPEGLDVASQGLYGPGGSETNTRPIAIPAFAYYRDTRDAQILKPPGDANARSSDPDSARHMALDAAASFSEAQRWFYVRENKELRDPRKQDDFFWEDPVLRAVRGALGLMLGGIGRVYADDDPPRMKAHLKDANGLSMIMDFSQLSAGQRNLMALTIDFARRLALTYPGWDNPLEAPGILLIDEIELNLHPKWQQTVIPHLRKVFPDTQIVVATHSPLVLSTLHARQIRILQGQQIFVPSVETYGTESDRVQRQVMNTDTTPPENAFAQDVAQLYQQIDADDLGAAEPLLARLEDERGMAEPTLIRARMLIANRRWEAELGL